MIVWKNHETGAVYYKGHSISEIHTLNHEIFATIRSCFGAGYWIDELPWVDTDVWKD